MHVLEKTAKIRAKSIFNIPARKQNLTSNNKQPYRATFR